MAKRFHLKDDDNLYIQILSTSEHLIGFKFQSYMDGWGYAKGNIIEFGIGFLTIHFNIRRRATNEEIYGDYEEDDD